MRAHRISALAVLEGQSLVGIVTERDFIRSIADGRNPATTHVCQYMTHSPLTIDAGKWPPRRRHDDQAPRAAHSCNRRRLLALTPWLLNLPIGESW
ncbi:MAG TPA: CBS domain-containing protein [Candidatus Dormibacteraeota bacterium]|nr:CBS domain-containing protein [Candidatus Dormibacteraeota bacterium]